jgi:hypothetical protein
MRATLTTVTIAFGVWGVLMTLLCLFFGVLCDDWAILPRLARRLLLATLLVTAACLLNL